jgi:xanthine dehydrogenase YagS FAD-binding subunit
MNVGRIGAARVAVGGVATKPWRAHGVETILAGQPASEDLFARAAKASVEGAHPRGDNAFKVALLERAVAKALRIVAAGERA